MAMAEVDGTVGSVKLDPSEVKSIAELYMKELCSGTRIENLVNEFEYSVIDWRAECRGVDKDYELYAREKKNEAKRKLLAAFFVKGGK